MYTKIIFNVLLIIGLAIFYLAFVKGLPPVINELNLAIVVLIVLLVLGDFKIALWWSAGLGFILDLYSFLPFGLYTVSLLCTIVFARFLVNNFFTNRSLYTYIALTFFATLFNEFASQGLAFLVNFLTPYEYWLPAGISYFVGLFYQSGMNIAAVTIIFYFSNYINKNLKPVFLFRNNS